MPELPIVRLSSYNSSTLNGSEPLAIDQPLLITSPTSFIVGHTYLIKDFIAGDDFSNIANVFSGTINTDGCIFVATGSTPTTWTNSSIIGHYVTVNIPLSELVASGSIGGISGIVQVPTSRDYLPTDAGNILVLAAGAIVTIPVGQLFGIVNVGIFTLSQTAGYETSLTSGTIYPAVGDSPLGSELVILSSTVTAGQTGFLQLGSGYITDTGDSKVKTFDRYMLDNIGGDITSLINGLTLASGVGKLGGVLTQNTTIGGTSGGASLFNLILSAKLLNLVANITTTGTALGMAGTSSHVNGFGASLAGNGGAGAIGLKLLGYAGIGVYIEGNGSNAAESDIELNPLNGRVKIRNLPTYADDTAAGIGGVTTDSLYKTSTGVLMIKL